MFSRKSYYYVKKTRALEKAKLSESSLASSVSNLSISTDESLKGKKITQQKQIVEVNNERIEIHDTSESLLVEKEADVDNVEIEAIDSTQEVDIVNSINTDDNYTDDTIIETFSSTSSAKNMAENFQATKEAQNQTLTEMEEKL